MALLWQQCISPNNMKLFNDTKVTFMFLWLSTCRKEQTTQRKTSTSTHLLGVCSVKDGFKVQIIGAFK